jgi:MFS family permease
MIVARAIQGAGAATLAPSTLALMSTSFPEGRQRARAMAAYGALAGIATSIGMIIGGVLTQALSWRVGFLLNVPIGVAAIVAAPRYLPGTTRHSGRLDAAGGLSSTLGVGALVFGIGQGFGRSTLTTGGMAGVAREDAGVAGGLVNVAHHAGGALGLGILVTIFAGAGSGAHGPHLLADRVSTALTGAAIFVACAMIATLIAHPRSRRRRCKSPATPSTRMPAPATGSLGPSTSIPSPRP